ncbi:MAG: WYL domain-containing protein [Cyanobacteria bacterium TGS_CYA1]|nr:WYL domain-containing protein [Cyanobacteria bacterium TGS_CYA1]MDX2105361.1 WYL domain-containing protein [Candidatus Melainabacteria bacterium]
MPEEKPLKLTQEEILLLLTSAKLFDKLVAGVTIRCQQKDELVSNIISKLSELVYPSIETMSDEFADAIIDSMLGCEDLDEKELEELEQALLEAETDEFFGYDFFKQQNPKTPQQQSTTTFQIKQNSSDHSKLEETLREASFVYPMYSVDDKLPVLEKSLLRHLSLEAQYYSVSRETVDKITIDPLVLLQENGIWLLVAYCHQKRDILLFRVDRVKDLHETNREFKTAQKVDDLRCKVLASYS